MEWVLRRKVKPSTWLSACGKNQEDSPGGSAEILLIDNLSYLKVIRLIWEEEVGARQSFRFGDRKKNTSVSLTVRDTVECVL